MYRLFVFFCLLSCSGYSFARDKIVGGVEAQPGEFPWIVTITTGREFCGGVIISPDIVLTAGHCGTGNVSKYTVTAGVHSLKTRSAYQVSRGVQNITVYPYYSASTARNDIALIQLLAPFDYTERIYAIHLADDNYRADGYATVAGWGVESETAHDQPDSLLKVDIPLVSLSVCRAHYASHYQMPMQILNSVICGGGNGKSSCFGDSGGPLMCHSAKTESGYICCGIVSAGAKCGDVGVYSRVSYFRSWIRSVANI